MQEIYTNITFRDFIAISEGKQVGVLYHFTRISSLMNIIQSGFNLMSYQKYISFTRNFEMVNPKYKNDLNKNLGDPRGCRIVIDGDKLSNKYKIEPFIDNLNVVKRSSGEYEERVKSNSVNILPYIKQIDFMGTDKNSMSKEIEILEKKNIPYNFVKVWKKVR